MKGCRSAVRRGKGKNVIALSVVTAVLALVLSALVGHQARAIGSLLDLVDRPDPSGGRKLHARPTPLVGGLAVGLSVIAAALLSQIADGGRPGAAGHFGWLAVALFVMTLIGMADDRHQLSPRVRLAVSAAVLMIVLYLDRRFVVGSLAFTGLAPIRLGMLSGLFSLVCLIGLLNAVNMADGKNGLVIGLGLIWSVVLMAHAPDTLWPVLGSAFAALSVLLWFNLHGRLFLGDGGSYGLSALFGLLAIDVYNRPGQPMTAEVAAVMFVVPVLDTVRLMLIRIRVGKSPFDGDRNHFHHRLADQFGWPEGLLLYLAIVGVPSLLSSVVPASAPFCLLASAAGYVILMLMTRTTRAALVS